MLGSSIWDDFRYHISKSTRLNQIILINITFFITLVIARIALNVTQGSSGAGQSLLTEWLSLHTNPTYLITHPWILATHMFTHFGLWHILWNMLMLYWFGNIVGDLLGDKMVWPVYIVSGLTGALVIFIFSNLFNYPSAEVMAYGASAAVMGFVLAATMIAPDYVMHLLLIGEVRLKYVAIVVILIDLVGLAENSNTGGHLGHIGGALGGVLFILYIRQGWSLHDLFQKKPPTKIIPIRKPVMSPSGSAKPISSLSKKSASEETVLSPQEEIDRILDKIRIKGLNSLTEEEKKRLDQFSGSGH